MMKPFDVMTPTVLYCSCFQFPLSTIVDRLSVYRSAAHAFIGALLFLFLFLTNGDVDTERLNNERETMGGREC